MKPSKEYLRSALGDRYYDFTKSNYFNDVAEALDMAQQDHIAALAELEATFCQCHESYRTRKLVDPTCMVHEVIDAMKKSYHIKSEK